VSLGLKPESLGGLNVWAEAQTYLRSNSKKCNNGKNCASGTLHLTNDAPGAAVGKQIPSLRYGMTTSKEDALEFKEDE
jgi:hypothetical protein